MDRNVLTVESREVLGFEPEWNEDLVGWVISFAVRNEWRVAPVYDVDDLISEAYLVFVKCDERYLVTEPAHFATLFRRMFVNRVHDIAWYQNEDCKAEVHHVEESLSFGGDAEYKFLSELPDDIRRVVELLANPNHNEYRRYCGGRRETTNDFLCRLAGVSGINMVTRVCEYCTGQPNIYSWVSRILNRCLGELSTHNH